VNNTGNLSGLGVLNINSGDPRLWLLNIFCDGGKLEANFALVNFINNIGCGNLEVYSFLTSALEKCILIAE